MDAVMFVAFKLTYSNNLHSIQSMSTDKENTSANATDEYMWVDLQKQQGCNKNSQLCNNMKDLEVMMRCSICCNLMSSKRIPVSIAPCYHTFCSECIRNSLRISVATTVKRLALCPVCRTNIPDFAKVSKHSQVFVPNKSVEEIVRHFEMVRKPLAQALMKNGKDDDHDSPESNDDIKSEAVESYRDKKRRKIICNEDLNNKSSGSGDEQSNHTSISNNAVRSVSLTKRQPLASVHYGSLKRSKLRELCAKYNLSTAGNEKQLKERHLEFITLHNADCDATYPRSYSELAAEVARREHSRKVGFQIYYDLEMQFVQLRIIIYFYLKLFFSM